MTIRRVLTVPMPFPDSAFLVEVALQVRNAADQTEVARRFAAVDRVRAAFLAAAADLAKERGRDLPPPS